MNHNSFLYIDVGESVLCLDRARQYYFTTKESELAQCKVLKAGQYVCKHQHTLLTTAAVETCAVLMLQKRETLPMVCDTRLVGLSCTVWTQLTNTRIYFAPYPDTNTILHHEHLVDVSLTLSPP